MGLALARRQVALMGGELEVDSVVDRGSVFSFTLRLLPAQIPVSTGSEPDWGRVRRLAPGHAVKALVADDVEENQEILGRMLADLGAEVALAEDGTQVLAQMDGFAPEIVFLDIRMPEMDGIETLRHLRLNPSWRGVKAVAVSASVLENERRAFLASGFDDFLDKPFRFEWVCAMLARLLGVGFVYGETEEEDVGDDWGALTLPAELLRRLRESAVLYSVTPFCRAAEQSGPALRNGSKEQSRRRTGAASGCLLLSVSARMFPCVARPFPGRIAHGLPDDVAGSP